MAARTVKTETCWIFQGCRVGPNGYGQIDLGTGKRAYAHRVAWEMAHGEPVPDGLRVLHTCDNPRCVNPAHLWVGTQAENIHDCVRKGRRRAFGRQHLTVERARAIFWLDAMGYSRKQIGEALKLRERHIGAVLRGEIWSHVERPVRRVSVVHVPIVDTDDLTRHLKLSRGAA